IGYEINKNFLQIIENKIGFYDNIYILERKDEKRELPSIDYTPRIQNAEPQIDPQSFNFKGDRLYKVVEIIDENTIKLDTGLNIRFLGVRIEKKEQTIQYLQDYILGEKVFLKFYNNVLEDKNTLTAYVYLKNKIFVNAYLIKYGFASPDFSVNHKYKEKFNQLWSKKQNG
ncbi:MAG: thermonuclease family protein, partial [Endomicrobiia bacterium]